MTTARVRRSEDAGDPVLPYELLTAPAPCDLVEDGAGCISRLMEITFFVGDEQLVLSPHQHASVGPEIDIWVGRAEDRIGGDSCTGTWAPAWYGLLVVGEAGEDG